MDRNKSNNQNPIFYTGNSHHSHSLQALKYNKRIKKSSFHKENNDAKNKLLNIDREKTKRNINDSQTDRKMNDSSLLSKTSLSHNFNNKKSLGTSITMKNLRIINNHLTSTKNSLQNTTRDHNTPALSSRALKQLVNHSTNKQMPKKISLEVNKTFIQQQNESINCTYRQQINTKSCYDEYKTIRNLEQNNIANMSKISERKKKRSQIKIIEEFSPMQKKDDKSFFNNHQDSKPYNDIVSTSINGQHQQKQRLKRQMNKLEESLTSPTVGFMHQVTQQDQLTHKLKQFDKDYLQKSNFLESKQIQSWHDIMMKNISSANCSKELSNKNQESNSKKSQNIFELERCTSAIQNLAFKNLQISPHWQKIIPLQQRLPLLKKKHQQLQQQLKQATERSSSLQYKLFQLSRQHIITKKQKQFTKRNTKNLLIQEAQRCQQELRLKLCSKADYEHIILFNQRVVLTGKERDKNPKVLYRQMFENCCTRKFVMIAKKQLGSLTQYDSKLILQFFKKIQQLQGSYQKHLKNESMSNNPPQETQYNKIIQNLVEQIQQEVIRIETMKRKINNFIKIIEQHQKSINQHNKVIKTHIQKLANKIAIQYKVQQGKQYNFEEMLVEKYQEQFIKYKNLIKQKSEILNKLSEIDASTHRHSDICRKSQLSILQRNQDYDII